MIDTTIVVLGQSGNQTSLIISILAFIISALSFAFTAYQQYFKRPRIGMILGEKLYVFYDHKMKPGLIMDLTIVNSGAQPATVVKMNGQITHSNGKHTCEIQWRRFEECKNVGEPGKEYKPHWGFQGWVQTIVVPSRGFSSKFIGFIGMERFEFEPGHYQLALSVLGGPKAKRLYSRIYRFQVDEELATFLREQCVVGESGMRKGTGSIRILDWRA